MSQGCRIWSQWFLCKKDRVNIEALEVEKFIVLGAKERG